LPLGSRLICDSRAERGWSGRGGDIVCSLRREGLVWVEVRERKRLIG
jgi:hypothetical protein